jgi:phenylacetate-coenzyme A ligase PaaK-like adenylate-forming protein
VSDRVDPAQCVAVVTSGTTGRPLRIIHSAEHLIQSAATELARQAKYGLPFDRKTLQPFKMGGAGWLEYTVVNTGFTRVAEFGFLEGASQAERAEVARRCVAFGPDVVFSHPSRIAGLVELLLEAGVQGLDVPVVRTFGETLTEPVRELLAGFFGGRIRNQYALNEVSTVASECDHGGMHLDADRLWVELLDADGHPVPAGVPGEVTVTNFFNPVMPFIRYRTDDIAAWSGQPCPCGDPAPTLSLIAGRDHGAIHFPDGTSIDALRVVRRVEHVPLSRLQVVQDDDGLTVLVTPLPGRTSDWAANVRQAVRSVVEDRLAITVREAADADFHRTGRREKTPSFVSFRSQDGRR